MIVYIDIILLINFLIDTSLLLSVGFLLKRKISLKRILLSSLIGSLSTLLLFVIKDNFLLLTYKLFTSIIITIISFDYNNFNYFKDNLVYLYIISIILGGTIHLLSNSINLSNIGLIYQNNGLKINTYLLLLITPLLLYKYLKYERNYQTNYSTLYQVEIFYHDKKISGTGFLDTGNKLKDPYFQRPIILINEKLIKEEVKTFLVPYYTVNNKDLLKVFSPKKVLINHKKTKKTLIGLTDINYNGIKIILNKEILWKK